VFCIPALCVVRFSRRSSSNPALLVLLVIPVAVVLAVGLWWVHHRILTATPARAAPAAVPMQSASYLWLSGEAVPNHATVLNDAQDPFALRGLTSRFAKAP